jgi:hypothetical protein
MSGQQYSGKYMKVRLIKENEILYSSGIGGFL